jgi:dimethylamine/trimethylamine dehydrogenase
LKNVVFVPNTTLDVNSAIEYGAEIVIAATGSRWAVDGLNGATRTAILGADANLPHCLTPEQIMVEGKHAGERVLVYDCEGYFMGVSLAERLALEGKTVTYVTHMATVAPHTAFTHESTGLRKKLQHLGVTLVTGHVLTEIKPGAALGHPTFDAQAPVEWPVDGVVLVTQRRSDDGLHRDLRARGDGLLAEGITGLYRIGDCVAPRLIADCIFDGHRLAREIDTDDPATPRPYIRERRVLGARDADYDAVLAGR